MEDQIRIEIPFVEFLDQVRIPGGDVRVPHMLPHHRPVLTFHQSVVIAMPPDLLQAQPSLWDSLSRLILYEKQVPASGSSCMKIRL